MTLLLSNRPKTLFGFSISGPNAYQCWRWCCIRFIFLSQWPCVDVQTKQRNRSYLWILANKRLIFKRRANNNNNLQINLLFQIYSFALYSKVYGGRINPYVGRDKQRKKQIINKLMTYWNWLNIFVFHIFTVHLTNIDYDEWKIERFNVYLHNGRLSSLFLSYMRVVFCWKYPTLVWVYNMVSSFGFI